MAHYNFAAGPSALPDAVLTAARQGLGDWDGNGQSVMEIPFTGEAFARIHDEAVAALRQLLAIPSDYRVLFLQGGAYGQFSLLPMNLLRGFESADYAVTGHWSQRAANEARRYCQVNIVADGATSGFTDILEWTEWSLDPAAAYCHITSNETANGVQYRQWPETGAVPLVADITSDFLMAPLNIRRFGLVYASAQKNAGIAGLTLVIIHQSLLGRALPITPTVFNYELLAAANSRVNTPPVWAVYLAGLMFKWILAEGGLEEMAVRNRRHARWLYQAIDQSGFYHCRVAGRARSSINVCFELPSAQLQQQFLVEAEARGLHNLKGHAAATGLRASLYNGVSEAAVSALLAFMHDFARCHASAV
ncbi:3-phosphoserine/phosphohydroxythreonine transaminase [Sedimenticola sp.]|uniref:3-phosphoserine/phosphohydroxythreonine transaminase n=1 Tax=Sedimenticola sp. TaxID=1940285 RepID=UPI00258BBE7A|nr:3-phosphoserine/phosphohydroxythreonine transaminase [Sedimenticola sp.]MCW8905194.1 3-phosphoserine/phosphohydroxythreonine transaminase [Sedimenticola sp.]